MNNDGGEAGGAPNDGSPPPPEGFLFPTDALARWINLPDDQPLVIGPLTRTDLDRLLFSIGSLSSSIVLLQEALLRFGSGDTAGVIDRIQQSRTACVEGETQMRKFFYAIMTNAVEVPRAG